MAFGKVEAIKHMIFIIELARFNNIETHRLINCDYAVELSHEWVLATISGMQKLWHVAIKATRSRNIERLDFGLKRGGFSFGNLCEDSLLFFVDLLAKLSPFLGWDFFYFGVF